ncbi:MAG: exodeoxyribonuclease VII large subunit [SAR202 cluster bacterium Casp-Chloro-G4]|nr:exodeoxyribonuclease VII large subunit [Chloroflexota bacterium]MDA1227302.1 exodeoxyribonuclease VII large subunit [Chloroflexota bacterium]PKB61161.1 MAG: exodeoxyribonuclease VII large subunit [SAR202 cluster bacterium Casp-Chloro-G4]
MPVYTVGEVSSYIKDTLERDTLLQDAWVSGEVSNLARPGSGHSYFTLRDAKATLRCVAFRGSRGAEHLDNGAAVIVHGRVSMYEPRGDLQLIVDIVQPEGVGELQLKLEQLHHKLETEGLFEPSRKRELPVFPQRIAVVTSPTGAVWHDIQTVINRRYPLVELALAPSPVQGDGAALAIVEAISAANAEPDVDMIILARGGGSLEDLWAFNEEAVARAIYASRVPVISAVGHETDYTIADLVADRRAPTPSAAAEMAVPARRELMAGILGAAQTLNSFIDGQLTAKGEATRQLESRLQRALPDLDTLRIRVDDLLRNVATHLHHAVSLNSERLGGLRLRLETLSPKDTLRRGYAIVQKAEDGAVLTDASQVKAGDSLGITLGQGLLDAEVTGVRDG